MITAQELLDQTAEKVIALNMTEAEFEKWVDEDIKAEWVGGEVIIMSPSSIIHVRLVGFLLQIMGAFARQRELGEILGPELQIRFETLKRRRVPDILFVARDRLDIIQTNHIEGAPDLVVEVVSPDSLARDWREKYLDYEAAGVREYWIIDPMAERVESYTLNEEKKYSLIQELDGKIYSTVLDGFYLKPGWLWQAPLPNPLEVLRELAVL